MAFGGQAPKKLGHCGIFPVVKSDAWYRDGIPALTLNGLWRANDRMAAKRLMSAVREPVATA